MTDHPQVSFTICATPEPQGSTRSWVKNGKAITTSTNKNLKPYRALLSSCAMEVRDAIYKEGPGAYELRVVFTFIRPRSVSPKRRPYHNVKPDLDKLIRAVSDAISKGVLIRDDSEIVRIIADKEYAEEGPQGVRVTLVRLWGP